MNRRAPNRARHHQTVGVLTPTTTTSLGQTVAEWPDAPNASAWEFRASVQPAGTDLLERAGLTATQTTKLLIATNPGNIKPGLRLLINNEQYEINRVEWHATHASILASLADAGP